jgi:hypothetical protein
VAGDFIVAWDPSSPERENFGGGNTRRNLTIAGVFTDEKAERSSCTEIEKIMSRMWVSRRSGSGMRPSLLRTGRLHVMTYHTAGG